MVNLEEIPEIDISLIKHVAVDALQSLVEQMYQLHHMQMQFHPLFLPPLHIDSYTIIHSDEQMFVSTCRTSRDFAIYFSMCDIWTSVFNRKMWLFICSIACITWNWRKFSAIKIRWSISDTAGFYNMYRDWQQCSSHTEWPPIILFCLLVIRKWVVYCTNHLTGANTSRFISSIEALFHLTPTWFRLFLGCCYWWQCFPTSARDNIQMWLLQASFSLFSSIVKWNFLKCVNRSFFSDKPSDRP